MSADEDLELLREICAFLRSPLVDSLLITHPNCVCLSSFELLKEWTEWWSWAGERLDGTDDDEPRWLSVLRYYLSPHADLRADEARAIPPELKKLVDTARRLQLPRSNTPVLQHRIAHSRGMSPKKAHEVDRMTQYIAQLLTTTPGLEGIRHAVDVGAGQAYLSRALRDDLALHVLALDWSDVQSAGAARKDAQQKQTKPRPAEDAEDVRALPNEQEENASASASGTQIAARRGSLTYRTTAITSGALLLETVTDWIHGAHTGPSSEDPPCATPVLLVALHACGSLTPSVLRAFLTQSNAVADGPGSRAWVPRAAVVVGCCYNLLDPADFPLCRSQELPQCGLVLTANHLQLAAQVPAQWLRTEESRKSASAAVRKVVWRALLEGVIERASEGSDNISTKQETSDDRTNTTGRKRVGRLNDTAYADWDTFIARSESKLELNLGKGSLRDKNMETRLEVLHVLRCILGPVIESLILLDRQLWLQGGLQDTGLRSRLVSLFDQETGSGRNVAIVITPEDALCT
ncbi:hypothetical protein CERSUDRAFT_92196 [Gelatoporia subvermispora B]|uniref:Methyltransferase domain-containing protein n=1 Tax=Ceriporiopsis subvermispora (strain B) TaxID=914234 RepID=M2QRI9_CERS8|nr:hypothetical protein CERSUDRAFT_92196 [Gelatoporia subvermispora B]